MGHSWKKIEVTKSDSFFSFFHRKYRLQIEQQESLCQKFEIFEPNFKKISDEIFGAKRKFLEGARFKNKNSPIPFSWAIHEKEFENYTFKASFFGSFFATNNSRKYRLQIEQQGKFVSKIWNFEPNF